MGFPVTVVLGASGRIGRVLRHCWPRIAPMAGAEIRWQSRQPLRPEPGAAAANLLDPLVESQNLAQLCTGAEVVLCLAGSIPGRGSDLADNSSLACAAVQAAAQGGKRSDGPAARVLLCSSAAVYGSQPGRRGADSPPHPANAYGEAKLEMEQKALALGRQLGVPVTALRIGNIAGLDACLGGWQPGFQLDQFADGSSPRRSYIGPVTLARVLAALVTTAKLPAVLNLAQPGALEMAALLRAAGHPFTWRPAPTAAIAEVTLDLSPLQKLLQDGRLIAALDRADAAQMVEEWSQLEPIMTPKAPRPNDPTPHKEKPS